MNSSLSDRIPAARPPTGAQLRRLGALVRGERLRRGWTMRDLRARSGVNEGTISRVERGLGASLTGAGPTEDTLHALAHALNLPVGTLYAALHETEVGPEADAPGPSAFELLFGSQA